VGLSSRNAVHFVITKGWVNFHEFARFQTEIDAALEAAIAALVDSGRTTSGRRIIKLP